MGISPKLLYRWQQGQFVAGMGNVEVACNPEVRQLRARLKRANQELDILKSFGHLWPANPVSVYQYTVRPCDLLLYVANWPAVRRTAWTTLLRARAIENVACALGVNRLGPDGRGHEHAGDSALLDAQGRYLVQAGQTPGVFTHTLRRPELEEFRARFAALLDGDAFELRR